MNYIIFDLEWNNVFNYKTNKGFNEIIEIGAVKLNDRLEIVDSFKQLIKPAVTKKLSSNFKSLTRITMEEIKADGLPFDEAFNDFARWCGNGDNNTVFLSWSQSDLYTLVDNFAKFKNTALVSFIKKYADAQSYCMQFIEDHSGNQISLANCAEKFEIDIDTSVLHRAVEDCFVSACCIKKVFDKDKFKRYINECDIAFFERLVFKNYFLDFSHKDKFDVNSVELCCPDCHGVITPAQEYQYYNNTFKTYGKCNKCKKKFWVFVRAKQTYDGIVITRHYTLMSRKRASRVD